MTTEQREKLAFRVEKLKKSYGVSYNHIAKQLQVSNHTIVAFAKGEINRLGDEKAKKLWDLTVPFFPEPKKKQVSNEDYEQ